MRPCGDCSSATRNLREAHLPQQTASITKIALVMPRTQGRVIWPRPCRRPDLQRNRRAFLFQNHAAGLPGSDKARATPAPSCPDLRQPRHSVCGPNRQFQAAQDTRKSRPKSQPKPETGVARLGWPDFRWRNALRRRAWQKICTRPPATPHAASAIDHDRVYKLGFLRLSHAANRAEL